MIRALALDVDGVLTDGTVSIDEDGRERKSIHFRDVDAVYAAHRAGIKLALCTGEQTPIVDRIAEKLSIEHVYRSHDKVDSLRRVAEELGVALGEVCYVGDGDRDAPALELAGLGLAPADGSDAARAAADVVLSANGGRGAVAEAWRLVLARAGA